MFSSTWIVAHSCYCFIKLKYYDVIASCLTINVITILNVPLRPLSINTLYNLIAVTKDFIMGGRHPQEKPSSTGNRISSVPLLRCNSTHNILLPVTKYRHESLQQTVC